MDKILSLKRKLEVYNFFILGRRLGRKETIVWIPNPDEHIGAKIMLSEHGGKVMMQDFNRMIPLLMFIGLLAPGLLAQEAYQKASATVAHQHRAFGIHDGNQIRTIFYNYGSIGHPTELDKPSLEWPAHSGRNYLHELGLLVGAEVVDARDQTVHILSEGLKDGGMPDPGGGDNVWGWEPLPGYGVPAEVFDNWPAEKRDRGAMAMSHRPETWGPEFPRDDRGNLLWPGFFGDGRIIADVESYFVMDDRYNAQYKYYPFPDSIDRCGLGVQVTGRGYQFAAPIAEDILFVQYQIKNVSPTRLEKVVVGMFCDPEMGGPQDRRDDFASFDQDESLLLCWDAPGSSHSYGLAELGWLGIKFLESPGNQTDGLDNDHDGFTDEGRQNGLDDDGDWQATDEEARADVKEQDTTNGLDDDGDGRIDDFGDADGKSDDVGSDGLPSQGEPGYDPITNPDPNGDDYNPLTNPQGTEGNGRPDAGEPDFDITDLDETDMLGLTSFHASEYGKLQPWQDDLLWQAMTPGQFNHLTMTQNTNNIFVLGSGYFSLEPGQEEILTLALIMGENETDVRDKARVAQTFVRLNFQYLMPPAQPKIISAEPGDRCVTLRWDRSAEASFDPIFGHDFEGYAVYRSTDKIHWGTPITNHRGEKVFETPIAQFDSINGLKGPHPVAMNGVHFYLGDDTGLQHVFVDRNLINGLTYYYAVTAYDSGSVVWGVPPLECARIFGGPNVVAVTPQAPAAANLDRVAVVPNPYVAASILDTPSDGSQRRVDFIHLPKECTIRIYTLTGEHVRTIEHHATHSYEGSESWNLQNEDGLDVAPGIYLYHVEAPGVGEKVGRIAVVK
ncbi:MAG: hypothetical protein ONB05_07400 [candidate division KSB1 bacterium]|nr:hypothetical protein [candidate division KSB1 bacterium]